MTIGVSRERWRHGTAGNCVGRSKARTSLRRSKRVWPLQFRARGVTANVLRCGASDLGAALRSSRWTGEQIVVWMFQPGGGP
jgi:hypothetical protein